MPTLEERLKKLKSLKANETLSEVVAGLKELVGSGSDELPPWLQRNRSDRGDSEALRAVLREGRATSDMLQDRLAGSVFEMDKIFTAPKARKYFDEVFNSLLLLACEDIVDGIDFKQGKDPRKDFYAIRNELIEALKFTALNDIHGTTGLGGELVGALQNEGSNDMRDAIAKCKNWVETYIKDSKAYKQLPDEERKIVEDSDVFVRCAICEATAAKEMNWTMPYADGVSNTTYLMAYIWTIVGPEALWCCDLEALPDTVHRVMRFQLTPEELARAKGLQKYNPKVMCALLNMVSAAFTEGAMPLFWTEDAREAVKEAIQAGDDPRAPFNSKGTPNVAHLGPVRVMGDRAAPIMRDVAALAMRVALNPTIIQCMAEVYRGFVDEEEPKYFKGRFSIDQYRYVMKALLVIRGAALALPLVMESYKEYKREELKSFLEQMVSLISGQDFETVMKQAFLAYPEWKGTVVNDAVMSIRSQTDGELHVLQEMLRILGEQHNKEEFFELVRSVISGITWGQGVLGGFFIAMNQEVTSFYYGTLPTQWREESVPPLPDNTSPLDVLKAKWPDVSDKKYILKYISRAAGLECLNEVRDSMVFLENVLLYGAGVKRVTELAECKERFYRECRAYRDGEEESGAMKNAAQCLIDVLCAVTTEHLSRCDAGKASAEQPRKDLELVSRSLAADTGIGKKSCDDFKDDGQLLCDDESGETVGPDQSLSHPGTERRVSQADTSIDRVS